jgi:excinuclease ABC subunit A
MAKRRTTRKSSVAAPSKRKTGARSAKGNGAVAKKTPARKARRMAQRQDGKPDAASRKSAGQVDWLSVIAACHNNLKNIDVAFPLARFVCVTGVSGSGKSSLVNDIVRETLSRDLNGAEKVRPGDHGGIGGAEHLDKVIDIDQSPIGRTPRSNPATYIKVFDEIRSLFARLAESKVRGYKPGRFSFNVHTGKAGGGRCESCEGNGSNKMEMELLADIWITCPICGGQRFSRETLQILYKGKNIADVLDMDVQEALAHFENIPKIAGMLRTLHDVGLDYLKLGQSSTTLSGGEAQRIKLARELVKRSTGQTLYILDEPTTGLHFDDIRKLLDVLHGFVDAGNTVLVIEHNLDVIKTADWVIDLGPEGGEFGGQVIATGTPEEVADIPDSHTGIALRELFGSMGAAGRRAGSSGSGKPPGNRKPRSNGKKRGTKSIQVQGARQHNLKGINVDIPRGKTTVCSGPSGSGKTSFAIDTVYTEGQRRYVESLSAYARQFLGRLQPPRVDHVYGLSPSVSIEQKNTSRSPRSTVGTVTEIYDYMRVLWARIGEPYCPHCKVAIGSQDVDEIVEQILGLPDKTRIMLLAPLHLSGQETYESLLQRQTEAGFRRVRVNGEVCEIDSITRLDRKRDHRLEVVIDRVVVKRSAASRLADSIEQALLVGDGVIVVQPVDSETDRGSDSAGSLRFSQHRSCPQCHRGFDELTPHHFSFNSRLGWCETCEGLGVQQGASPSSIVIHPTKGIGDGAIGGWGVLAKRSQLRVLAEAVANHIGFDLETPWHDLDEASQQLFLQGCGDDWIALPGNQTGRGERKGLTGLRIQWRGFFPAIDRASKVSWQFRKQLKTMAGSVDCRSCRGSRLREESAAARVAGRTIREVCGQPLAEAYKWFRSLKLSTRESRIAGELLHEVTSRLKFLCDVGLDYVTLNRTASTLSGGESQRIQLASQIGTGLTGVLYVLDEPTIGLHPRDNRRLIEALQRLRDLGNTLLLVEHDREIIDSADHVLDFGPQAGTRGGEVTAAASPTAIRRKRASLTGKYLSGKEAIAVPANRRDVPKSAPRVDLQPIDQDGQATDPGPGDLHWLTVRGARENNLKEIDACFPVGRFSCVTGVSGSGKSTLISEILYKSLAARIHRASTTPGGHQEILGAEHIDKVINVDQTPIGNSPTSNPATYTGLFDLIRELYAKLPTAKIRGYTANRFSFNRAGGRCEACAGMGMQCIEMHFLPDVWVECDSCQGKRYVQETLDVRYHDRSIADVLDMRVSEALGLFANVTKVRRMLQTLDDVGLGYIQLGQPAPTLSGGESQRVKLASELGRPSTGKTLYILDEPTTGLHFDDLKKLLGVLHRLVDLGNTCVCVEHNLDLIKTADWIIDLGPEAGNAGGHIVACGAPEAVAKVKSSHTGKALAGVLAQGPTEVRERYDLRRQLEMESGLSEKIDLGDDVKMPWETDGKKWHTVEHVDSQGQMVGWDTAVLVWLVDTISGLGKFAEVDWNHRSRVEITASRNKQWFAHFLTAGSDLLEAAFRVPDRTISQQELAGQLRLKTLDERTDLKIYGQWSRCKVCAVGNGWTAIRLSLRDFKDVKKPAFTSFLKKAVSAYFGEIDALQKSPDRGKPWKKDGRHWHLSQKGIGDRHVVRWKPDTLMALIGRVNSMEGGLTLDWGHETSVQIIGAGERKRFAKLVTNIGKGVRVELFCPEGGVTPAMIDRLGTDPEIRKRPDGDWVTFWVRSLSSVDTKQFRSLWRRCRGGLSNERLQFA